MSVDGQDEPGGRPPTSNTTITALEARVVQLIEIAHELTERAKEIVESSGRLVEEAELLMGEMSRTRDPAQGENSKSDLEGQFTR